MYLEWSNVDLKRGVLRVQSNRRYGFKVKDSEQRDVPIPADLRLRLEAYRAKHPQDRLVTGTETDSPNTKMLRTLKRVVRRAGLNCGECHSCESTKECDGWYLHKFRATAITTLLQSGMDLRTVMKFSGHSDLAAVLRYLRPAHDEAIQAHISKVKWM